MNNEWFEVWASDSTELPYLLLLRPSGAGFEILDPAEKNRKVHEASTYEDARYWLLEQDPRRGLVSRARSAG